MLWVASIGISTSAVIPSFDEASSTTWCLLSGYDMSVPVFTHQTIQSWCFSSIIKVQDLDFGMIGSRVNR